MTKKSIDFYKTSNMAIEINKAHCPQCQELFYELDGHELEQCPHCNAEFYGEPSSTDWNSDDYMLIVDHKTGIPSVIRNDEYEPVLKEPTL